MLLLSLTLLLGPWRLLRNSRNPISDDLRRDIGLWGGLLGTLHAAVGQCVHLRGRPWLYYVYGTQSKHFLPLRHDLFGVGHWGAVGLHFEVTPPTHLQSGTWSGPLPTSNGFQGTVNVSTLTVAGSPYVFTYTANNGACAASSSTVTR